MRLLLTGGAGYIGSHTLLCLIAHKHTVCVFDNFCNAHSEAVHRVARLTGQHDIQIITGDIRSSTDLDAAFAQFQPDAVIHFAGLKAVGESVVHPLRYYETNVTGTANVLRAMTKADCNRIVFSSSATVYGAPDYLPVNEAHALSPTNPYGWSKLMAEQVIRDWVESRPAAGAVLLRYFNPVGAHESGMIGEDPSDIPNNLMPYIAQVAVGRRAHLRVFGDDYDTPDGTGQRDYIHVMDLAEAHVAALDYTRKRPVCDVINIGNGTPYSVLDLVQTFERAAGKPIPYQIVGRRQGDVACSYADPSKAQNVLQWCASRDLACICESAWHWQTRNPYGYGAAPKDQHPSAENIKA